MPAVLRASQSRILVYSAAMRCASSPTGFATVRSIRVLSGSVSYIFSYSVPVEDWPAGMTELSSQSLLTEA